MVSSVFILNISAIMSPFLLKIKSEKICVVFLFSIFTLFSLSLSHAADPVHKQYDFDIAAGELGKALQSFAIKTDSEILFTADLVKNKRAKRLRGRYADEEALRKILVDSGLTVKKTADKVYLVQKSAGLEVGRASNSSRATILTDTKKKPVADLRIEEIIVSAQKRDERLLDVPIMIGVLSGIELADRGISNMKDLSLAVPELTVTVSAPGQSSYILRGIGALNGDSLVGVYLDEAPVTGTEQVQLDLRTTDLERVEVLHGPQGTLYGQGSAGGTIRFITKDPNFDGVSGELDISAYATKQGEPSQAVVGILNMPIIDNVLALRLAATYENTGGWNDTSDGRKDVNDQKLSNVRVKALWRPVDSLDIKGMAIVHRNDAGFSNAPATKDRVTITPEYAPGIDLSNEDSYDLFNLTASYDLGFAELLSSSSYTEVENDGAYTNFLFGTQRVIILDHDTSLANQEFRLASKGSDKFTWTAGVTYSETDFSQDTLFTVGIGPTILAENLLFETNVDSKSWAVFGDLNYQITDRLSAGLGIRVFDEEKEIPGQKGSYDSVDPRLYVSYSLTDTAQLYASVADGFRSGGFNTPGLPFPETYDPESIRSFELGLKTSSQFDGVLSGEVAIFRSDYSDLQATVLDSQGNGFIANTSKAEVMGIDLSLTLAATERLLFKFYGNIIDTEVTKIPPGNLLEVGDELNFVPDSSFTVSIIYDIDWSENLPGSLRLDYNKQGEVVSRARNLGLSDESDVVELLNARATAQWQDYSFDIYASNLLDEDSILFPSVTELHNRARPRTIGFSVSKTF